MREGIDLGLECKLDESFRKIPEVRELLDHKDDVIIEFEEVP